MSRLFKGSNADIFIRLDKFCETRGLRLVNSASPRWIASENKHRAFMSSSRVRDNASFSPTRKLARLEFGSKTFFCTTGFENPSPLPGTVEIPLDAAFLTVILAELAPRPRATISEIRDVVESGDKDSEQSYSGHAPASIAGLFPFIRIFEVPPIPQESTWKIFFKICIEECELNDSWIEAGLSKTLHYLCEVDEDKIPYRVLCRSIFDGEPSNHAYPVDAQEHQI
jgi:hypothetical protein